MPRIAKDWEVKEVKHKPSFVLIIATSPYRVAVAGPLGMLKNEKKGEKN